MGDVNYDHDRLNRRGRVDGLFQGEGQRRSHVTSPRRCVRLSLESAASRGGGLVLVAAGTGAFAALWNRARV